MENQKLYQVIRDIGDRFGADVLGNEKQFLSVFSDLAPEMKKERNILSSALRMGAGKHFLHCPEKDRERAVFRTRNMLDGVIVDDGITLVISCFSLLCWGEVWGTLVSLSPQPALAPVPEETSSPTPLTSVVDAGFEIVDGVLCRYRKKAVHLTIPAGVTIIGSSAFSGRKALKSVVIPEGVTEIRDRAFASCHSLTSVTFPKSLKHIDVNAFANCISLQGVSIPKSCSVDASAFSACKFHMHPPHSNLHQRQYRKRQKSLHQI